MSIPCGSPKRARAACGQPHSPHGGHGRLGYGAGAWPRRLGAAAAPPRRRRLAVHGDDEGRLYGNGHGPWPHV